MADELPFKAEYAKTGRAGCKGCKQKIGQESLRLAVMVQSAFYDGKQANWFHERCFFNKQRPASSDLIDGFNKLRNDDQARLNESIATLTGIVVPEPKGKGKGKKRGGDSASTSGLSAAVLKDFGVEYAVSGRAACAGCFQKIPKDEVRIKKTAYDTEVGMKFGGQPIWHHVECFAQLRSELGWYESGEYLPGFKTLSKDDKAIVKKHLPPIKQEIGEPSSKKMKTDIKDDPDAAKLEQTIAKQNKEYFKFRDELKAGLDKAAMVQILERNKQAVPAGKSEILDHLADVLTFGAILPCSKCKDGRFVLANSAYTCNGNLSEWAKCGNIVREPERKIAQIPSSLKAEHPFLSKSRKVQLRALRPVALVLPTAAAVKKEEVDGTEGPRVIREKPPLYNMEFVIIGKTKLPKEEIKTTIQRMGGKLGTKIHEKLAAVISTEEEVEKMNSRMSEVKDLGIQVVPDDFLEAVKGGNAISYITSKSICDWGTDPNVRIPQEDLTRSLKSKSIYTKSVPKSMSLKLKNGAVVDPDSGLEDKAHVYREGKLKYFAILGKVDIQNDRNSYYKLQLLESDSKQRKRYWIFRSWGRISTTIGNKKTEECGSLEEAIQRFDHLYEEKTGNAFGDKNFVKHPGLYYKMDIDYGEEADVKKMAKSEIKSQLAKPVQDLIQLLFDVDVMKKMLLELHVDTEKMPLGKISPKQITSAMKVLKEISELIQSGAEDGQFIDASNRFYTLIPHDFGVQRPQAIKTVEQITSKMEMLDSLLEMELAYDLLTGETDSKKNPLDNHYEQLKCGIAPVDKASEEFKLLCEYARNTHGATHTNFELEVDEVFKVSRSGEERRYKPFKKLHNRQLLWHGSRLTNYVGILSHGLKIAPPEAPVTGYMFGKGVYFADMVSKSANYCCTSKQNSTGLMLLCEVALGDMMEYNAAEYVTKLPKDKHSTKGVGKTYPNPEEEHIRGDGVKLPMGKPLVDTKVKSSLLYNEYIVYDVAQVKVEYLFKMNFKHKF